MRRSGAAMRVCLVYDCLFPHTVGGAERWYRALAERLAADGHDVTYLTMRQWARGTDPGVAGVDVRVVAPRMALYSGPGQRRILPPLVFGAGVLWHLLRHGRRYDIVHTCAFPYFSLLAAGIARPTAGYRLIVDWFEVWSRDYWREYLGSRAGDVGWLVQRLCAQIPQRAFCFSKRYARRLHEERLRGAVSLLAGAYDGSLEQREPVQAELLVVFAGRHIPEKQVPTIPAAIARLRAVRPGLRAIIFGDGPERDEVVRRVAELGLDRVIEVPGFVETERVDAAFSRAACLVNPSRREGYGLVVVEAAAHGTPTVVVDGPDNAAVELIEPGVNGAVAATVSPLDLAGAIETVLAGGEPLRASTRKWFRDHAVEMSLDRSIELALAAYASPSG